MTHSSHDYSSEFIKLLINRFVVILAVLCFDSKVCHSIETLTGGWYLWDPYQYLATPGDSKSLTGLDIELQKQIMERAGYSINIPEISWKQHNEDLVEGNRDFAMGAFTTEEREKYNYLVGPYRYEENSVFVLRENDDNHKYQNISGFIATIKENNFRIGVVDGYRYANDEFNKFVDDPENDKYLVKSPNDNKNLYLLMSKDIDGFIADKIVGATIIWREKKGRSMTEISLTDSKAPIYMLLSKKTVNHDQYVYINNVVKNFIKSEDYKKIISWYLYPVLLLETVDSFWFYLIELLGMASFALSGVLLAYRLNATLLGTFLLALIPSFGGGIFRDVIFGRYPIGFLISTNYILLVLFISISGFFIIKLFNFMKKRIPLEESESSKRSIHKPRVLFDVMLMLTDAVALSVFTVSGVIICMLAKVSPLWLWGPFLAFLTGAGGGFVRDIIVKDVKKNQLHVQAINGGLYGEISIVWGGALSLYLHLTAHNVDPISIRRMVLVTMIGVFVTRVIIYVYKIPNITFFKQNPLENEVISK